MFRNPWMDLHMQGEMDYTGGGYSRKQAAAMVRSEFAGAPDPKPCHTEGCNGSLYYRATVGAMMCPDCRAMTHMSGKVIR